MSTSVATVEEEVSQKADKSVRKRMLILIVSSILVLVVALTGLFFSGILTHRGHDAVHTESGTRIEKPNLIDVPDIVTNLDSGPHRTVFVKLKAKIEVAHVSDQAIIIANMPRIMDAFQTYLRSMRPEELHGGEGTYRLREALMNRIDTIATPVQVLDVLFVEMLVQ
jgi:flagellar FliL protein